MAQGKGTRPATAFVQPKVQWKNQRTFRHDLFKLEVAMMQKNVSWRKKRPELVEIEHAHFFHSHSSSGTPQKYCAAVGGHFHEITTAVDQNGNIVAKCGPALRKVDKRLSNGTTKTEIEEIIYNHEERKIPIVDDHTHDMTYVGSEQMSPQKIKQIQTANAEGVSEFMQQAPVQQEPTLAESDAGDAG